MPATPSEAYKQSCQQLMTVWEDNPLSTWTIEHISGDQVIPGVPIQWPNIEDNIDRDRVSGTDKLNPWAHLLWQPATGRQTNVGRNSLGNRFEHTGTLSLQINVPVGEGLYLGLALATMASNAFAGAVTSGGVWYKSPRTQDIGNLNKGSVYRVDFLTDFQFDEVK